ncbi:hypothetical protein E2K69_15190 [Escherichia coli]|nr:hypothetical protein E2K69_15190 [Escherichia coli]
MFFFFFFSSRRRHTGFLNGAGGPAVSLPVYRVNTWLRDADDPRLNSIVQQLFRVLRGLHD